MNLTNEFKTIRKWAFARGIYTQGDLKTQTLKLQEEIGELAKAIIERDELKTWDAIGDCIITLTNIAELSGMPVEKCINESFNEIKNREGKMINGTFVKNKL